MKSFIDQDKTPIDWNSHQWERPFNPWFLLLGLIVYSLLIIAVLGSIAIVVHSLLKAF
jgi:hypothetical protein